MYLDGECKFITEKGGNQEQVKHKWYTNSCLYFDIFVFYDWPSPHYFAKNAAYIIFPFDSWLSFQRLCRFYGDIIFVLSTAITVQIILLLLSLPGMCAYSGLQDVGNRHEAYAY